MDVETVFDEEAPTAVRPGESVGQQEHANKPLKEEQREMGKKALEGLEKFKIPNVSTADIEAGALVDGARIQVKRDRSKETETVRRDKRADLEMKKQEFMAGGGSAKKKRKLK